MTKDMLVTGLIFGLMVVGLLAGTYLLFQFMRYYPIVSLVVIVLIIITVLFDRL